MTEKVWSFKFTDSEGKETSGGYVLAENEFEARAKVLKMRPGMPGILRAVPSAMTPDQLRADLAKMKARSNK